MTSSATYKLISDPFVIHSSFTKILKPYRGCVKRNKAYAVIKHCASTILTPLCQHFTMRVIKTIRFMLHMAEEMLNADPTIIFILYVRDPRGTILSRMGLSHKLKKGNKKLIKAHANVLCSRMKHDYKSFISLSQIYPNNFWLMKYEDLALKPNETSNILFHRIGKTVPESVRTYLETHTQSKHKNFGGMGTMKNSSYVVSRWKTGLSKENIDDIISVCSEVLNIYGYDT